MNAGFVRKLVYGAVWPHCLVIFATVLFGSLTVWALPKKGTPAPPLQFTQLLQASPGARADWPSLRGKVVVLEFWATWCEGCVAELPDLNKLAATLDPAKFQFISVDDENPKVVQTFLAKRKMAGWAGIDTTGGVFKRFGVDARPTTIIVDRKGRIVAVTHPQHLTTADLQAVANGKDVKFEPVMDMDALKKSALPAAGVKPLFELSLIKAPPDAENGMSAGGGRMNIYGWNAKALISFAYRNVPEDRFLPTSALSEELYNLHAAWSTGEDNDNLIAPFLQMAITYGLKLRVESKTVTKKAYVLKATEAAHKLMTPTASTGGSMSGYWKGKLKLVNGSMDALASSLEDGLEVSVVNETGIEGKFDAELEFPAKDAEAAKAALLKTLGLELIEAERPIQMLEVSPREEAKKAEEAKPQQAPKP
jgi:uncharacterized protein (TIGR03435 family)